MLVNCGICKDDITEENLQKQECCQQDFCKTCYLEYIKFLEDQRRVVTCPNPYCKSVAPDELLKRILSYHEYDNYKNDLSSLGGHIVVIEIEVINIRIVKILAVMTIFILGLIGTGLIALFRYLLTFKKNRQ